MSDENELKRDSNEEDDDGGTSKSEGVKTEHLIIVTNPSAQESIQSEDKITPNSDISGISSELTDDPSIGVTEDSRDSNGEQKSDDQVIIQNEVITDSVDTETVPASSSDQSTNSGPWTSFPASDPDLDMLLASSLFYNDYDEEERLPIGVDPYEDSEFMYEIASIFFQPVVPPQAGTTRVENQPTSHQPANHSTAVESDVPVSIADDPVASTSGAGSSTGASTGFEYDASQGPNQLKMRSSVTQNKRKCQKCNKKVGLTAIQCRCGGVFCSLHRYDREHGCTFDYKAMGEKELKKNNPQIVAEKVRKI